MRLFLAHLALSVFLLLAPSLGGAAEIVGVAGKKLSVVQKRSGGQKLRVKASDLTVRSPAACGGGGELLIEAAGIGGAVTRIPLEAGLWEATSKGCRYRRGPVASRVQFKSGDSLKVSADFADLGIPLDIDPRPVRIEIRFGGLRHCMEFGGVGSLRPGSKLRAKDAARASACIEGTTFDPADSGPFNIGLWQSTIDDHTDIDGTPRPLPVVVWYPTEAGPNAVNPEIVENAAPSGDGPFPLIVFSHGASGNPTASSFLTEHLATHGFVVAAVQHPLRPLEERAEAFANRPGEVKAAVDFVVAESEIQGALLQGAVDETRLGITGHSFGGLTTIALLGESDNRFLAGMPMAPGIRPGDAADVSADLPEIHVPLMFMLGEQDTLAPYPYLRAGYNQVPDTTDRRAFVFPTGTHFSYSDACLQNCQDASNLDHDLGHELVRTYGAAFFQVYLAGQQDFAAYLRPALDISGGSAELYEGDLP